MAFDIPSVACAVLKPGLLNVADLGAVVKHLGACTTETETETSGHQFRL